MLYSPSNHYEVTIVAGILGDSELSRSLHVSVGIYVLHSAAVLCLVIRPCGTVQRIHAGECIDVPSSHHWPPAKVPSTPPLLSVSSYLPVKASGAGWGPIRVRKRIAGPDTHSPEPLQALVLYFSPVFVNGNLQMNGLICFQTVGMNLSVREQVSRRASAEQKTA